MNSGSRDGAPSLRLVTDTPPKGDGTKGGGDRPVPESRDLDWSILMARAQAGDGAAYRRLLEEICPYLRSLAARSHRDPGDAEDAVQDILLTVHAIRATYDPLRPFGPWLYAIASRRLVDRLRRQGRRRQRELALASAHEIGRVDEAIHESFVGHRQLEDAIESLPAGQRKAIRLLKLKELSLNEAASASGMSVASLKVSTHRALKSLRRKLFDRNEP